MIVVGIVGAIISTILGYIMGTYIIMFLWGLLGLVMGIIGFAWFVMLIVAAVKAYGNNRYSLPVVGKYAEKWS